MQSVKKKQKFKIELFVKNVNENWKSNKILKYSNCAEELHFRSSNSKIRFFLIFNYSDLYWVFNCSGSIMDVDGEKEDVEMASDSDSDDMNAADEAKEKELNDRKSSLMNQVCIIQSILKWSIIIKFILCPIFQIKNDKTDYYAYVELIKVLSELGQLDELRKIREDFNEEYPLSPGRTFLNASSHYALTRNYFMS